MASIAASPFSLNVYNERYETRMEYTEPGEIQQRRCSCSQLYFLNQPINQSSMQIRLWRVNFISFAATRKSQIREMWSEYLHNSNLKKNDSLEFIE